MKEYKMFSVTTNYFFFEFQYDFQIRFIMNYEEYFVHTDTDQLNV